MFKFKIIITILTLLFCPYASTATLSCKAIFSDIINPFVKNELAKYENYSGNKEFESYKNKLAKIGQKDVTKLTEREIDNIKLYVDKLQQSYSQKTVKQENYKEPVSKPSLKDIELEFLTLDNIAPEVLFYTLNRDGTKNNIVFSKKLISELTKKNLEYLEHVIFLTQSGITTHGKGIMKIINGQTDHLLFEIRSVDSRWGNYRTYGVQLKDNSGTPYIYFLGYLKDHTLGNGIVSKKVQQLIKNINLY